MTTSFRVGSLIYRQASESFKDKYGLDKWVTIPAADLTDEMLDQLFSLVETAYKPIGGHVKLPNAKSLLRGDFVIYANDFDDDPAPDVMSIKKKTPFGEKSVGLGQDGSPEAKKKVVDKTVEFSKTPGYYAELSGAIANIVLKKGGPVVDDEATVRRVLKGKDLTWVGENPSGKFPGIDGWYARNIGGKDMIKIMVGLPR